MEHAFLEIGHRGMPGWPRKGENTMRSFRLALAKGADALEFDVRKTKDGQLVVIHDSTIDRTTDGHGNVHDLSYGELMKFDAGFGERIPRLADMLDEFGGKCLLNIELKEQGIEKAVKSEILGHGLQKLPYVKSVIVSAFDADDNAPSANSSWEQLKVFAPEIPIALIARMSKIERLGDEVFVRIAKEYRAKAIVPMADAATTALVELAHEEGLLVYTGTINNADEAELFRKMGVDGIFSDCVERL